MRKINISLNENYEDLSMAVANRIAAIIQSNPAALLCLAAGDTPLGALRALVDIQAAGHVNLRNVWYVGLDEWLGLGYQDKGSCAQIMQDSFYGPAGIPLDHVSVFNGLDPDTAIQTTQALAFITAHGGITLALLGIGMNGHLGFNEPGTSIDFPGGVVNLAETTRTVGTKYFDKPFPLERGITVGLRNLLAARHLILMANGEKKAAIVAACMTTQPDSALPASWLPVHPGFELYLDRAAASGLPDQLIKHA